MEIDVELTNRQYEQIIEHCEQYHLDTKKYFGEKLLDGFYFEIYGDLNEKNRIKEEIKRHQRSARREEGTASHGLL